MITINCERYGERLEFESLGEAQTAIRECGPEFASVTLVQSGDLIYDERGECVGFETESAHAS